MNKLIGYAKLFFAFSLISAALSCGLSPKSDCGLSETDGKIIIGTNQIVLIGKNNFAPGDSSKAENDGNLRACGYVAENAPERGNLYWMQTDSEDVREAKRLFGVVTERLADTDNYSIENIAEIGEEAKLSRFENNDSKKLEIAVRKGKDVILITVSKPAALEIPVEEVKSLARRIADKTDDY